MIKRFVKNFIFFPWVLSVIIFGGGSFSEYNELASFFRNFPSGWIDKNGIISVKCRGRRIKMKGASSPYLIETFRKEIYSGLNIAEKDVVDVGTAFGDSTVYFGLFGARKVYGYEINKRYYEFCKENLKLNNLMNCEVELCGVGQTPPSEFKNTIVPKEDVDALNGIKMKSLFQIVKEHNIKKGILKVDVEGYEYEIFDMVDLETLSRFDQIIIEYHFGVKDLANKLTTAGFVVKTTPSKNDVNGGYFEARKGKI